MSEPGGTFPVAAFVFAVGLAMVHLVSGTEVLSVLGRRRRWLSAAGGASVAHVLVLLLPEVSEAASRFREVRGDELLFEQAMYVVVLLGFVFFYGVEVIVVQATGAEPQSAPTVYWADVGVFAVYSAIVGYLLFHQEVPGVVNPLLYAVAMAFHFTATDYGIRRHLGTAHDRLGRWVLASATLLGADVDLLLVPGGIVLQVLFAFVAGSIVLNVIKEELPEAPDGLFVPFAAGAAAYTALVLFV